MSPHASRHRSVTTRSSPRPGSAGHSPPPATPQVVPLARRAAAGASRAARRARPVAPCPPRGPSPCRPSRRRASPRRPPLRLPRRAIAALCPPSTLSAIDPVRHRPNYLRPHPLGGRLRHRASPSRRCAPPRFRPRRLASARQRLAAPRRPPAALRGLGVAPSRRRATHPHGFWCRRAPWTWHPRGTPPPRRCRPPLGMAPLGCLSAAGI